MDESVTRPLDHESLTFFRGRVGLNALLKALNIETGDHIAIQAFTCLAVPEAILAAGASPVYVDIESNGFNMDAADLERKLTPQIKAIVVQHTYGIPADMDWIQNIAESHGNPIIEDCCHTFISKYKGREVGSFGVGSFYSFEWGKPVVAGIGGSLNVNDPLLLGKVRRDYTCYSFPKLVSQTRIELQYYAFGLLYRPLLYWPVRALFHTLGSLGLAESNYNPVGGEHVAADFNLRMSPAVKRRVIRKLKTLENYRRHSRWVADQYRNRIHSELFSHPGLQEDCDTVFARYPLLSRNKAALLAAAKEANVELADWYATPVHPLGGRDLPKVYYERGSCPNAEARCHEVVTLPTHSAVRKGDIDRSVKFLNKVRL